MFAKPEMISDFLQPAPPKSTPSSGIFGRRDDKPAIINDPPVTKDNVIFGGSQGIFSDSRT
jgi:hypothetical protein